MMRVCHLDTCPVGIATQNPELRARFSGKPEFVETFFEYIAEEVREHLAALGFRTLEEAVGQVELLDTAQGRRRTGRPPGSTSRRSSPRSSSPDGSAPRTTPSARTTASRRRSTTSSSPLARDAIDDGDPVAARSPVRNVNRTVGTMLGHEVTKAHPNGPARRHHRPHPHRVGRAVASARSSRAGITLRLRRRRQRLRRQGPVRRAGRRAAGTGSAPLAGRGQRHRRQRHRLRRDHRRALPARPGRRAVLRAQLRRHRRRRGRGRPRLRVHDRRHRRRPRPDRAQLRRRHVRWRRPTSRPRPRPRQPRARRPRAAAARATSTSCATCSSATVEWTESPVAARLLADWDDARAGFTLVLPRDYQRVLDVRAKAEAEGLDLDGARGVGADHGGLPWLTPRAFCRRASASCRGADPCRSASRTGTRSTRSRSSAELQRQAGRCMDCGIPFCHSGCPLGNLIPEWNDLAWSGDWREAIDRLHATNNFPEFTGRLCPAPCETACVLGINQPAVTIKQVEVTIIDRAFADGTVTPQAPERLSGKTVAVVGSGPGRARRRPAADPRRAHRRRLRARRRAGRPAALRHPRVQDGEVRPRPPARADGGRGHPVPQRRRRRRRHHRARSCATGTTRSSLAIGATVPATCRCPGRELDGVMQAMEFLPPANRVALGAAASRARSPPTGKDVIVIGGGDTGADCLGTAHRQGAAVGDAAGDHAAARRGARRGPAVADLPDDLPRRLARTRRAASGSTPCRTERDPRRRRRAAVRRCGCTRSHGRERLRAGRGHRARDPGAAGAARHGLPRTAADGLRRAARRRARRARRTSSATTPS